MCTWCRQGEIYKHSVNLLFCEKLFSVKFFIKKLYHLGVMHSHVQCDGCKEHPLRGIRWKCRNCENYDLCTRCYMDDEHDFNGHRFKRIQSENAKG